MTLSEHLKWAGYYRKRVETWIGEEEKNHARRLCATHEAAVIREEVRSLRQDIKRWPLEALRHDWHTDLEEARERWREAIDDMNWTGFYVERPSAARQEAA